MRKLKLQVQMSADGFVGGPNGELDFMEWNWDEALKQYVSDITGSMDTILLGRKMTPGFVAHWEAVAANPEAPDQAVGQLFTDTRKVVFSKTLPEDYATTAQWPNTEVTHADLTARVNELKAGEGKDIIVYGGAEFVSGLVKENLIDEYILFVNPSAIGNGLSIFGGLQENMKLQLTQSRAFDCGIVALHYVPVKG